MDSNIFTATAANSKLPSIKTVNSTQPSPRESARTGRRRANFYSSFLDTIKEHKPVYETFMSRAKDSGIL